MGRWKQMGRGTEPVGGWGRQEAEVAGEVSTSREQNASPPHTIYLHLPHVPPPPPQLQEQEG